MKAGLRGNRPGGRLHSFVLASSKNVLFLPPGRSCGRLELHFFSIHLSTWYKKPKTVNRRDLDPQFSRPAGWLTFPTDNCDKRRTLACCATPTFQPRRQWTDGRTDGGGLSGWFTAYFSFSFLEITSCFLFLFSPSWREKFSSWNWTGNLCSISRSQTASLKPVHHLLRCLLLLRPSVQSFPPRNSQCLYLLDVSPLHFSPCTRPNLLLSFFFYVSGREKTLTLGRSCIL